MPWHGHYRRNECIFIRWQGRPGAGRLGACRGSGLGVLPNSGEAEATGDLSRYVHPVFLCTADTCASRLMLRGDGALGEESDGLCSRIRLGRGSAARKKVGRRDL